ncbi:MAG: hypothetical protein IT370_09115 [Deltaproteobacteria bacterium]|nr:hypothetical protein [Deltaproteobacteria bacterium]
MPVLDFAFSLVEDLQGDLPRTKEVLASWAWWRHHERIANREPHLLVTRSIDEALRSMLDVLKQGDQIGHLYLYSHGHESGLFLARVVDDGPLVLVKADIVAGFLKSRAKQLAAVGSFATDASILHLYGCNLGKSAETAGLFLSMFFARRGRACGPNTWFNLLRFSLRLRKQAFKDTKGPDGKACLAPRLDLEVRGRLQVDHHLREIEGKIDQLTCLTPKQKEQAKQIVNREVPDELERSLIDRFREMKAGGQIAYGLRDTTDRARIVDGMWTLVDLEGGLLYPFMSRDYLHFGDMPQSFGELRTAKAITLPDDQAWASHWIVRPAAGAAPGVCW